MTSNNIPPPRHEPRLLAGSRGPRYARPLTHFWGSPTPTSPEEPEPSGRVLMFEQLGLRTFSKNGPRLELTADDVASGTESLRPQIAEYVAERLAGPADPAALKVRFDPNIGRGAVYPGAGSDFFTRPVAEFRVYLPGQCPKARARARSRDRVTFWVLTSLVTALLAVAGFLAGGPLGAFLAAGGFLALMFFLIGR